LTGPIDEPGISRSLTDRDANGKETEK